VRTDDLPSLAMAAGPARARLTICCDSSAVVARERRDDPRYTRAVNAEEIVHLARRYTLYDWQAQVRRDRPAGGEAH
jgi:hypothetical protein